MFYNTGSGKSISIAPNVQYWMKVGVDTSPSSASYYLKIWQDGTQEPTQWDIIHTDLADPVINGSMMLIAHRVDASFGNVTINPITGFPNLPPVANSDSAYVLRGGDVDIEVLLNDYDPDGFILLHSG
jgi:hypothetical protein